MSVTYGQSGYVGQSRSVRSRHALRDGKLVPTEMAKHLRKKKLFKGIKARQAIKPTEFVKDVEWTEWEGRSRNYMRPVKYQAKCRITRKGGTMVTLQVIEKGKPSGKPFRKKESNLRYL